MYKKGDLVQARDATRKMRVQRDQKDAAPDRPLVRCEWEGAGYDLRAFNEEDLVRSACVGEGVTSLPLLPVQCGQWQFARRFALFRHFAYFLISGEYACFSLCGHRHIWLKCCANAVQPHLVVTSG